MGMWVEQLDEQLLKRGVSQAALQLNNVHAKKKRLREMLGLGSTSTLDAKGAWKTAESQVCDS